MTQQEAQRTLQHYLDGLDESVGGSGFGKTHLDAYNLIIDALMAYRRPMLEVRPGARNIVR